MVKGIEIRKIVVEIQIYEIEYKISCELKSNKEGSRIWHCIFPQGMTLKEIAISIADLFLTEEVKITTVEFTFGTESITISVQNYEDYEDFEDAHSRILNVVASQIKN